MFHYRVYGIKVSSTHQVSLLEESEFEDAEITVRWNQTENESEFEHISWKPISDDLLERIEPVQMWQSTDKDLTRVCLTAHGGYEIVYVFDHKNSTMDISFDERESTEDRESYFVSLVMGSIVRLTGRFSLHSSAVSFNGEAIAFVGHSTAGKSTLATAMTAYGAKVVSDDIVVPENKDDSWLVHPGYPRLRLRPGAADALAGGTDDLAKVYEDRDSFYFKLHDSSEFENSLTRLSCIYLLGDVSDEYSEPSLSEVTGREAALALLSNVSGLYLVRGELRAKEFETVSEIVKTIPVKRLHYAHDVATIPEQCKIIFNDFRHVTGRSG